MTDSHNTSERSSVGRNPFDEYNDDVGSTDSRSEMEQVCVLYTSVFTEPRTRTSMSLTWMVSVTTKRRPQKPVHCLTLTFLN